MFSRSGVIPSCRDSEESHARCVNMARRLVDCGVHVTAVYDVNRAAATKLADELRCAACQDLSEVTAESDVIITVVSDDAAMRKIFAKSGDSLLVNARGKLFINCATITPG